MLLETRPVPPPHGVLPPCRRCGVADQERMHALMAIWFSAVTAMPVDSGYFYLCPRCYEDCVVPRIHEIFRTVTRPGPSSSSIRHQ